MSARSFDETDWPQFLPWSEGRIGRSAKARLVGRRILAVRDQRRLHGPEHRVELLISGSHLNQVRLTSGAEIVLALDDAHDETDRRPDPDWEPSYFLGLARGADREFHRQFLKLWDAAGTTKYDKQEWRKFCRMLQEAGYWA